jgi:hypothetical protein
VLEFNQKLQKIDLFRFEYSIVFQIFPEKKRDKRQPIRMSSLFV